VHAPRGQLHDEQQVKGHQAVLGPHLDGRKVDGGQYVPVRPQKVQPRGSPLARGRRLDAMVLEDVAHGDSGDRVPEIGQGTLNPVVAPTGIVPSHLQDKFLDLGRDGWPTGFLGTTVLVVPFLGDELLVPA